MNWLIKHLIGINLYLIALIPILFLCILINFILVLGFLKIYSNLNKKLSKRKYSRFANTDDPKNPYFTVGFFHPFCNSGGGGERVLWSAIKVLQDNYPNCVCVIYTGDTDSKAEQMIENVSDRFKIDLNPNRTHFIFLKLRFLVLDKYPFFTLLGQSLGSLFLAAEAFIKFIPDVYFETTGYAFSYPLFHFIGNVPVCCYTHYPTISTDMLDMVSNSVARYNNRPLISQSRFLTQLKLKYYRFFAKLYSFCGRCSDCIMVNSSWTQSHINNLWSLAYKTQIVYPPCDVCKFEEIFSDKRHDENFYISSVAQFRPEKNHQLQIAAFAKFIQKLKADKISEEELKKVKLLLIGSCRNKEDENRVAHLEKLSSDLNVKDIVDIKVNFKFDYLLNYLAQSAVGIHSMIDEHFGIGVVECMASGTLMVAHNSAGPKMDIVVPYKGEKTGFLAETEEEFAECLYKIYTMSVQKRNTIREAAREHVKKFSQEKFNNDFIDAFNTLCFLKFISNTSKND